MRILVLSHNYPRFDRDPAGAFVRRIAVSAATQGAEILVLAPHAPGLALTADEGAVCLRRFRYAPELFERVAYTGDLHRRAAVSPVYALGVPLLLAGFLRAGQAAVREFRPDVVHAHWWLPGGWVASRLGVPYLVTCHGSDVRLLERALFRRWARPVFKHAGAVTAVSRFLAGDLRRMMGEGMPEVLPLVMPVEAELFRTGRAFPKAKPPRILYAGNLVPSKGVDILIRAYASLRDRGVSCQLKLLGEGSAAESLRALADSIGARDVIWSPFVPQDRMPAEYGVATVCVLPSLGKAEGLGLALVEALLGGTAVIGSTAGGIPEVIEDGVTGLLVPDGDAVALASALGRMLADTDFRSRSIAAGQDLVERRFTPEHATAPFVKLYRELISG
jgi:glycosyltransferase involved in cell wall biosynthesis